MLFRVLRDGNCRFNCNVGPEKRDFDSRMMKLLGMECERREAKRKWHHCVFSWCRFVTCDSRGRGV